MENKNRLGIVKISQMLVNDFGLMSLVFSRFIPLSIGYDFISQTFEYKGYSPEFDEVKEGGCIPKYDANITYNEGEISLDFVKEKVLTWCSASDLQIVLERPNKNRKRGL